jgi:hypothetical protein
MPFLLLLQSQFFRYQFDTSYDNCRLGALGHIIAGGGASLGMPCRRQWSSLIVIKLVY